jgi:O-antigen/teichoic acid export membrane protein
VTPVAALRTLARRGERADAWQPPADRSALLRNATALMVNTVVSSGLGLVYWLVAARLYPASDVGRDSAVLAALVAVSSVAQLNLAVALPRLLPVARQQARSLVTAVYLTNLCAGALIGLIFTRVVPYFSPQLAFLREDGGLVFTAAIVLWGMFSIQDSVLIGQRRSRWVPVDNAAFGVVKLVAAGGFAMLGARHGIYYSWILAALLLVGPVNLLIYRRLLPAASAARVGHVLRTLRTGGLLRYMAFDYGASLLRLAYISFVPLFVVTRLGSETNAYFFMALTVALALDALGLAMGTSLTVEAAYDESALADLSRQALRRLAWLLGPAVLGVLVCAPLILSAFGGAYAQEGATPLRLLALATVPRTLLSMYAAVLRVRRRGRQLLIIQAAVLLLGVGCSVILIVPAGATGVALAWLIAHALVAAVVAPRLLRDLDDRASPRSRGRLTRKAA